MEGLACRLGGPATPRGRGIYSRGFPPGLTATRVLLSPVLGSDCPVGGVTAASHLWLWGLPRVASVTEEVKF